MSPAIEWSVDVHAGARGLWVSTRGADAEPSVSVWAEGTVIVSARLDSGVSVQLVGDNALAVIREYATLAGVLSISPPTKEIARAIRACQRKIDLLTQEAGDLRPALEESIAIATSEAR